MKLLTIMLTEEQYRKLIHCRPAPISRKTDEEYVRFILLSYAAKRQHTMDRANQKRMSTVAKKRKQSDKQAAVQYLETKKQKLKNKTNEN